MALSFCALALLVATAPAQIPTPPVPASPGANVRYAQPETDGSGSLPKRPASNLVIDPQLVPPPVPQGARTIHIQKEMRQLRPASAVLAPPIGGQDQKPKNGGGYAQPAMPAGDTSGVPVLAPAAALFRLETENKLVTRENVERTDFNKTHADKKPIVPDFPMQTPLTKAQFQDRVFNPMAVEVEASYVCYRRLFFEDKNAERYGWDLGPIQPFVSLGYYLVDATILPYRFCAFPRMRYDCSAGQCLPGDPVPYMIYPPGLSLTGAAGQTAVTVALFFTIFP